MDVHVRKFAIVEVTMATKRLMKIMSLKIHNDDICIYSHMTIHMIYAYCMGRGVF